MRPPLYIMVATEPYQVPIKSARLLRIPLDTLGYDPFDFTLRIFAGAHW